MTVRANDQVDGVGGDSQRVQTSLDVIEQRPVTGVDQDALWAVDKIGVAIVAGHRLPEKCVEVVVDFHTVCSLPMNSHAV
jgi:hypothetical protein